MAEKVQQGLTIKEEMDDLDNNNKIIALNHKPIPNESKIQIV